MADIAKPIGNQEPAANPLVGLNYGAAAVSGTSYGGVGISGSSLPPTGAQGSAPVTDPNVTSDGVLGEGKNGVHGVGSLYNPGDWVLSNGVLGTNQAGIGVHGVNGAGSGTTPKYGCGIWGESDNGYGVYGASKTASAVYGISAADNLAGEFVGDVSVSGNLTAVNLTALQKQVDDLSTAVNALTAKVSTLSSQVAALPPPGWQGTGELAWLEFKTLGMSGNSYDDVLMIVRTQTTGSD